MSLQQVKTAGPAKDYDPLYSTKELTTDAFVETMYTDLSRNAKRTTLAPRASGN